MRKRILTLGLISTATIVGGVLIFRTPSLTSKTYSGEEASLPKIQGQRNVSSKEPVSSVQPVKILEAAPEAVAALPKYEYQKELDTYSLLRKKVFLSDAEKSQKTSLLKNEKFVRSLRELLKIPSLAQDDGQQNNAALDLLFDALKGENRQVARDILKSVIQDPGTENTALSMAERKALAGVKAEVLFHWSAMEPNLSGQMQQWLPGPVSQNIWKNVQAEHKSNLEQSRHAR